MYMLPYTENNVYLIRIITNIYNDGKERRNQYVPFWNILPQMGNHIELCSITWKQYYQLITV